MGDFEKKWSDAFEGAEATPSKELWTGIHAKLANAEVAGYKKGMVYYRWAAAVALLLLVGVTTYTLLERDPKVLAEKETSAYAQDEQSSTSSPEVTDIEEQNAQKVDQKSDQATLDQPTNQSEKVVVNGTVDQDLGGNKSDQDTDYLTRGEASEAEEDPEEISAEELSKDNLAVSVPSNSTDPKRSINNSATKQSESLAMTNKEGTPLTQSDAIEEKMVLNIAKGWLTIDGQKANTEATEATIEMEHIYLLPLAYSNTPIIKDHGPKLWAGLSFAPGSFDPNYSQQAAETQLVAAAAPNARSSFIVKEDNSPGLSMAMGIDFGMNLSNRWRFTSGLQYFNSSVDANTNVVAEASNTPVYNSFSSYDLSSPRGATAGRYIFAPNTDLQSTFEFLSIPAEAGYIVLDRRLQLILNAGVGTNIFIKNNIQDKQNTLADVTITPGAGAPFKSVYFNGLVGVEALYGFGEHFNLSLKPHYRVALNEFTKSSSNFSSRPNAAGVSLGLQYLIK